MPTSFEMLVSKFITLISFMYLSKFEKRPRPFRHCHRMEQPMSGLSREMSILCLSRDMD